MAPKIFFVTGTSTGLGAAYAQAILNNGDVVVAAARRPGELRFDNATDENFLAVKLDVTQKREIDEAFDAALKKFGRVDVVCNNAGYGLAGPFEELEEEQMRAQFEINYWSVLALTRRALEVMREQVPSGGLIQNVTSMGGQWGFPLFTQYCASKFAIEGFTESLSLEVKPEWGIKFTCIEPGGFRTNWAGSSMAFPKNRHPAYDHIDAKEKMAQRHGTQAGDPAKGGKAMYELANLEDPPLRAIIGSDALKGMHDKLEKYGANYGREDLTRIANSCDVEE